MVRYLRFSLWCRNNNKELIVTHTMFCSR